MAEEPAPALVATPHEAQKNRTGSNASIKEAGVNIARDFTPLVRPRGAEGLLGSRPIPDKNHCHVQANAITFGVMRGRR